MRGQAILTHIAALRQSAADHVPAEQTLQTAQQQQQQQPWRQTWADAFSQKEDRQWNGEGDTDQATPEPVHELPPVEDFVVGQAHAGMNEAVFGNLLIEPEAVLP